MPCDTAESVAGIGTSQVRPPPPGYVDLYEILDRVSCWCCANKNQRELRNIYRYLPDYWKRLEALQDRIERPMKKWHCKEYGDYGSIRRMAEVFRSEEMEE